MVSCSLPSKHCKMPAELLGCARLHKQDMPASLITKHFFFNSAAVPPVLAPASMQRSLRMLQRQQRWHRLPEFQVASRGDGSVHMHLYDLWAARTVPLPYGSHTLPAPDHTQLHHLWDGSRLWLHVQRRLLLRNRGIWLLCRRQLRELRPQWLPVPYLWHGGLPVSSTSKTARRRTERCRRCCGSAAGAAGFCLLMRISGCCVDPSPCR